MMAHLLGSRNCLESLSKDVFDLDEAVQSVMQKVGKRLEFVSWKFPGKNASQLDINELLDDYSYCKDEESNRLSHIIMFELVIDRFCLLLQVVSKMFDQILESHLDNDEKRPESKTVTTTMSIGLVSKKFWSKLTQFQFKYKNLSQDLLDYNQSLMEMEKLTADLKLENQRLKNKYEVNTQTKPKLAINFGGNNKLKPLDEQNDLQGTSISTQTFETAFVECATCETIQSHLLDVGGCVVSICETQSLPSAVNKQNKIIRCTKLSCNNVNKWSSEIQKDLQKVSSMATENLSRFNDLEIENENLKETVGSLEISLKIIAEENARFKSVEKELINKCESLQKLLVEKEDMISEMDDKLNKQLKELEEATRDIEKMKDSLNNSNEDVEKYKSSVRALEQGMNSLSTQLESTQNSSEKIQQLEQTLNTTTSQLEICEKDLQSNNEEMTKLKSEKKMLLKHDQTLQTKHKSLLSRLEEMDERCEELQSQLGDVTEEKEQLEESNEPIRKKLVEQDDQIERLKATLEDRESFNNNSQPLKNQNQNMVEYEREIEELRRKLDLVICFPVMGDEYRTVENQYTKTLNERHHHDNNDDDDDDDDVAMDMERQLKANTARIAILEKQNSSLRNTLVKLDANAKQHDPNHTREEQSQQNHEKLDRTTKSAPHRMIHQKQNYEPKPPSETKSRPQIPRPRSGGRRGGDDIQARLANLEKLKNDNVEIGHKKNNWTVESRDTNNDDSGTEGTGTSQFVCPDCRKEHISKRDLDIHRPFCFARL